MELGIAPKNAAIALPIPKLKTSWLIEVACPVLALNDFVTEVASNIPITAIAKARNPLLMAKAFKDAVISGRNSFLAGRMSKNYFATASSPSQGII